MLAFLYRSKQFMGKVNRGLHKKQMQMQRQRQRQRRRWMFLCLGDGRAEILVLRRGALSLKDVCSCCVNDASPRSLTPSPQPIHPHNQNRVDAHTEQDSPSPDLGHCSAFNGWQGAYLRGCVEGPVCAALLCAIELHTPAEPYSGNTRSSLASILALLLFPSNSKGPVGQPSSERGLGQAARMSERAQRQNPLPC